MLVGGAAAFLETAIILSVIQFVARQIIDGGAKQVVLEIKITYIPCLLELDRSFLQCG